MKINEIFESIQGEGKYAGYPMLFIRTSGCNLNCEWCDTKHEDGKYMDVFEVATRIRESKLKRVCWTGGEPLLQEDEIKEVIYETPERCHHLETNGTRPLSTDLFEHISVSPKSVEVAKKIQEHKRIDVKVVTDLQDVGTDLILYADILMPLTTNSIEDQMIKAKVWNHCVKIGKRYGPRLHVDLKQR